MLFLCLLLFKGLVYLKMYFLSLITHPHVVPNEMKLAVFIQFWNDFK